MASLPPDDRPAQPRDPELWNRTGAAVHAAGAAADAHLARGGYRPGVGLLTGTFDSGWPNLSRARLFAADDTPTDYWELFGFTVGTLNPDIQCADATAVMELLDVIGGTSSAAGSQRPGAEAAGT